MKRSKIGVGALRFKAETGLPASLQAAVTQQAPKEWDNLLNFSDRVWRGEDRTNPAVYQRLSNPDFLRNLSDQEFFVLSTRELSEADRKHFAAERGRLRSGAAGDKPGDLNTGAVKLLLDTRLRELGIDPTPKDDGGADAMRVGAIRRFVDQSILEAQAAAGKKFTDAEITKHIDRLFAQTDVIEHWYGNASSQMLAMKVGDIPSDVKDRLRADFRAAGVSDPTDGQLLGAYFKVKGAQGQMPKIVPLSASAASAGPAAAAAAPALAAASGVAPTHPASPATRPWSATQDVQDVGDAGSRLDAARVRFDAAKAVLDKFGSRQQRQDPEGYAAAQAEMTAARALRSQAESAYQATLPGGVKQAVQVGGSPAATPKEDPPITIPPPLRPGAGVAEINEAADAAKAALDEARARFRRYGGRQQQEDPKGFEEAKRLYAAARARHEQALRDYHTTLPEGAKQPSRAFPRP